MLNFPVSPGKVEDLRRRMKALTILEGDLTEHFYSPNHGRLRKSRAAVAILLRHVPTGREVRCESTTNQRLNRFIARRALVRAIENEQNNEPEDKLRPTDERPDQHMARMFAKSYERDVAQPYPAARHVLLGDSGIPKVMIGILGEPKQRGDSSGKKRT